ncbi:prolyl oligopeptidase family protein [Williamsia sp. CHRR-6]|uniref:prolyl oligopeptidase family serine peptidase n=1 Tax=Williamsia sp. CHRR-6 TaxID=2835871 RepID=UPI001BDA6DEC|nr:prolyl oligopeptidase family serine peptidase [Williamsia sp. CHRR-6]MBT0566971.1 S9 family peptidase [Williamsia sp. CHRR-6]
MTEVSASAPTDDPYLWLEEVTGDDALAWVRQHNAVTVEALTGTTRFAEMRDAAHEILDTDDRIPYVVRRGEYLYNFWRDATNTRGLWRRTTMESYRTDTPEWDVIIDLDALAAAEGENWVWGGAAVRRPDHDRALVSLSRGGADAAVVREFDLTTRTWVDPDGPDHGFTLPENKSQISWIDRDTVYVGTDFGLHSDGLSSLTDSGYPRIAKRWTRGTPLESAEVVLAGHPADIAVSAVHDDTVGFARDFVVRATDFFNELTYEIRPEGHVLIEVPTDANTMVHRQWLLVLTRSDWERGTDTFASGTLVAFDYESYLSAPHTATATVLFTPDAHTSLQSVTFTDTHLVLTTLHDVATELRLLTVGTWESAALAGVPEFATVSVLGTDPDHGDEIFLTASGFTTPPSLLHGTTTDGVSVLKQTPAFFDADGISAHQHFVTSDDGTSVPYFVIKRDDVTDGPTLLYGYGGFEVSQTPGYMPVAAKNWIARGGIYAIANIRGGGEYGPTWHTQALKAGRHLAYEDFASVARDLVARGLTTPAQLGAMGGSNGGLLMGVMTTSYPELFGAIVCQVPLLDMKRFHLLLAGASWVAEYGNPDDPAEWEFISTYSPYQRLSREATYPAILVTTSTRDDRVHPGHARKFTARLEEYGHPVRYYENIEGGHGGAADNKQAAFKMALADEFLWQTIGAASQR